MPPPDNFGVDSTSVHPKRKPDLIFPNRQEAFRRVFLYLQALRIPEDQALDLTREAFQVASSNRRHTVAGSPSIPEAMRALRELLPKRPLAPFSTKDVFFHDDLNRISSMPALNRGFMVPDVIDLIPLRTFVVRSLKRTVTLVSRLFIFWILFIFFVIVFLMLTL